MLIEKTWKELKEEFEVLPGTEERRIIRANVMEEFIWFITEKYGLPETLKFEKHNNYKKSYDTRRNLN